jgi:hypothetical protein
LNPAKAPTDFSGQASIHPEEILREEFLSPFGVPAHQLAFGSASARDTHQGHRQ